METLVWLAAVSLQEAVGLAVVDRAGLPAVSADTARWLRGGVNSLVRFLGDDRPIDRVSVQDVARWVAAESGRGLSAVSVNSNLRAVKTLYSRLQSNDVIGHSPARPVRFLPEPPPRPRAVAVDDYMSMRDAATCARDRGRVDVLLASGSRRRRSVFAWRLRCGWWRRGKTWRRCRRGWGIIRRSLRRRCMRGGMSAG